MTTIHEKPPLKNSTLWVMTVATGVIVANLYYNQPLLGDIANEYHVDSGKAGQVSMITQIGYATGMLLIAPLADMYRRKRLMLIDFVFMIAALIAAAAAPDITLLMVASFFVGVFSMIPQMLVPMAAHLAKPSERGKKIGAVMSGLLIGILLSRTFSGFIGAHFGWRSVFYIAAGLMVVMWGFIFFFLPEVEPDHSGSYKELVSSMGQLIRTQPKLRIAALRGALCFGCFSAFWTTLTFLLKQNFGLGSDVAGLFGLVGAFGALAAGLMGRLSDKMDAYKLSGFTLSFILISFIIFLFSGHSIGGMIIGVIILDMGVQATHISNQSIIFALVPEARNRINTIYMVSYFIGGSIGAFVASKLWDTYQWEGVCVLGMALSAITIIIHLLTHKDLQNKPAVTHA